MRIEFTGAVFVWRGPAPFCFVAVPDAEWGVVESRVEAW